MGSFKLRTKNGYDFYEVASALQKSIRRNDVVVADSSVSSCGSRDSATMCGKGSTR